MNTSIYIWFCIFFLFGVFEYDNSILTYGNNYTECCGLAEGEITDCLFFWSILLDPLPYMNIQLKVLQLLNMLHILTMKIKNSRVPITVPWGTKESTGTCSETAPSMITLCVLICRKDLIHLFVFMVYSVILKFM